MAASGQQSFIGVDVGGTKILGVSVDSGTGHIRATTRVPTPRHVASAVADAVAGVVEELLLEGEAAALGVGVPGLVDHQGVLRYGPNVPGILDFDIASSLRRRFGLPVAAGNDASNAALAELRLGAAKGARHAVVITQGTGIGGALIVEGQLVRGAHGFAGEPGHMLVDQGGHRCACGQRGCWESVASGAGLANVARELIDEGRGRRVLELAGGDPAVLRGEHVSTARAEGDPDAVEIFDRFATWVARGLGSLISLLDPELIVLGGGLTATNQHFLSAVQRRVMDTVIGGDHRPRVPVVPAQMGEEAGAVGAALDASDLVARAEL